MKNLKINENGELWLNQDNQWVAVVARRCFPWSGPEDFISIQDLKGQELVYFESLTEVSSESAEAIKKSLKETTFHFDVVGVHKVEDDFELRHWEVSTQKGVRKFQTKLNQFPEETATGGLLVRDVYGDVYHIKSPDSLPEKDKQRVWAFLE